MAQQQGNAFLAQVKESKLLGGAFQGGGGMNVRTALANASNHYSGSQAMSYTTGGQP